MSDASSSLPMALSALKRSSVVREVSNSGSVGFGIVLKKLHPIVVALRSSSLWVCARRTLGQKGFISP